MLFLPCQSESGHLECLQSDLLVIRSTLCFQHWLRVSWPRQRQAPSPACAWRSESEHPYLWPIFIKSRKKSFNKSLESEETNSRWQEDILKGSPNKTLSSLAPLLPTSQLLSNFFRTKPGFQTHMFLSYVCDRFGKYNFSFKTNKH